MHSVSQLISHLENSKKATCSVCRKESGICTCTGCKNIFCEKDFSSHRQWLSGEFETIIEDRNLLQEQMNNKDKFAKFRLNLLTQIDQWESVTSKKLYRAAERTRHYIVHFLNEKERSLENEFKNLTKQLSDSQYMRNIDENDLAVLKNKIDLLENLFEQLSGSSILTIHTEKSEQIDWAIIIYADEKSVDDSQVFIRNLEIHKISAYNYKYYLDLCFMFLCRCSMCLDRFT